MQLREFHLELNIAQAMTQETPVEAFYRPKEKVAHPSYSLDLVENGCGKN